MGLLRCERNEHTYDDDEYQSCPYCRKTQFMNISDTASKYNKLSVDGQSTIPIENLDGSTVPVSNLNNHTTELVKPKNDQEQTYITDDSIAEETGLVADVIGNENFKKKSNRFDSKTKLLFAADSKNFTNFDSKMPLVGWLVIVHGIGSGNYLRILAGVNHIGREVGDVVINFGDISISREKHAKITFNPDDDSFFLSHLNGFNLTKVNQKVIIENHKLNPYDYIQLGQSELIFLPLCGHGFNWKKNDIQQSGVSDGV